MLFFNVDIGPSLGFGNLVRCKCLLVFCISGIGEFIIDTTFKLQLTFLFPYCSIMVFL
jgi:hypothetical protein